MAAGTSSGSSRTSYYQIFQGRIAQRLKGPAEGSVTRITKANNEVHEMYFDYLEGKITKVETVPGKPDKKIPDQLMIELEDSGEYMQLSTPLDSSYSLNLLNRLCACDLSLTIKLSPYDFKDKETDRPIRGVNVMQTDMQVKPPMNRETPGMPGWERIDLPNGEVMWNKIPQLKFFLSVLNKVCKKNSTPVLSVMAKYTMDGQEIVSPNKIASSQGRPAEAPRPSAPPPGAQASHPMAQQASAPVHHERQSPYLPPKAPADFDPGHYPQDSDDDLPF